MMFRNKKKLPRAGHEFDVPIQPEQAFFAVGDLHGCDRLLDRLLRQLDELSHPDAVLVMTGDYVDRGEETAKTLRRLTVLSEHAGDTMHCILGNHEQMLLDMLDDPAANGPRWLRHGGLQTLASYKTTPVLGERPEADWIEMRDRLAEAMGQDTIDWLRGLPLYWQTGNVVVVHAGADPDLSIEHQDPRNLLWGHPEFTKKPRQDGLWVVHGHTIVDAPRAQQGRIPTDTGAYATGILTAALVEPGEVSFFQT